MALDDLNPEVSVADNFDSLLIPAAHPSRSESDTFYVAKDRVLRTHTTAHQVPLLRSGLRNFTVTGQVFRRDEIDRTHYPVFHQTEGVSEARTSNPKSELVELMQGLLHHLFPTSAVRVTPDEFPFTVDSMQAEVWSGGDWLEVLGCGIIHPDIGQSAGCDGHMLAWGIGLERLAMLLFDIPDIRLFWSREPEFLNQFQEGTITRFTPFSHLPAVTRDISFWVPAERWSDNDFLELARECAPELVQRVETFDDFRQPQTGRRSLAFRVTFQPVAAMKDSAELTRAANDAMARLGTSSQERLHVAPR